MKLITREIAQTILPNARKLIEEGPQRSHDELCTLLLEMDFVRFLPLNYQSIGYMLFLNIPPFHLGLPLNPTSGGSERWSDESSSNMGIQTF